MVSVHQWTGLEARALRHALRLSVRGFAEELGVAVNTVSKWESFLTEIKPNGQSQAILDTALTQADATVHARFEMFLSQTTRTHPTSFTQEVIAPLSTHEHEEYDTEEQVESINAQIRHIVALDNRVGGADLVRLSTRFFQTLQDKIGMGTYSPRIKNDLYAASGELAEVIGWLAYDAENHELTSRMNRESLYYTRLAGNRTVELLTLQNCSMHAGALGRTREALHIARTVLAESTLSPRVRALFLIREARALAQGGDDHAIRVLQHARSLYSDGLTERDPSWAWWVDERELSWHEAMVRRDLGMPTAFDFFERSVAATPATETRSQYLHQAYLLQAQVELKMWDGAVATIHNLAPLSLEVASTRTEVLIAKVLRTFGDSAPVFVREEAATLTTPSADA